jgi:hypothetical protein
VAVLDWIKRHQRKLLTFLGVSGLIDLIFDAIKNYAGDRLMGCAVSWLGPFGYWLIANPVALLTLAVGVVLVFLGVGAVQVASTADSSTILDSSSQPFLKTENQIAKWTVGFLAAIVLIVFGLAYGTHRYYSRRSETARPVAPAPPQLKAEVSVDFVEPDKPVSLSTAITPCMLGKRRWNQWVDNAQLPGGPDVKRPLLLIKPEEVVFQSPSDPKTRELLLKVSVTNRGEATIAQDWTLCLVHERKPFRYRAVEVTPELQFAFGDRVSLSEATLKNSIEHGRAAFGWLLFQVPEEVVGTGTLTGSLECRDYLEHRSITGFGAVEPPEKGALSATVK